MPTKLAIVSASAHPDGFYWAVAKDLSASVVECTLDNFFACGPGSCRKWSAESREAQAYVSYIVSNWVEHSHSKLRF